MRATSILLIVLSLSACGAPETPPASTAVVEAPPATLAPPSAPPTTTVASITPPDDFTMALGGGPAMRPMPRPGEMHTTVRLEPHPGTAGAFDLVERNESAELMLAAPRPPIELRRVAVPAARVQALWTSITTHRAILEGPCANPEIRDGTTNSIEVHASGTDSDFRCMNASTPEFDSLQDDFRALVAELLPPPSADS